MPLLLLLLLPVRGHCQQEIDRIVAVVGNDIILLSELKESVLMAGRQLNLSPGDSTQVKALENEILQSMIEEKVIFQRAKIDGIEVSDEELNESVKQDLDRVISRFGSREDFERALADQGLDLYSYREQLKREKEKQLIQQKFMQTAKMPHVRVSDEDARKFFDENYGDKALKPASVLLREIVLEIRPSEANLKKARDRAVEARRRIDKGETFESVASDMSDDESTKDKGGDLGFVDESDLLPSINSAVATLFPGEVSGPVETAQGVHLFKIMERRGSKIHLRHILFKAAGGTDPLKETMGLADSLVARIGNGEDFGEVARQYSTDEETRDNGGLREEEAIESLPDPYRTAIGELEAGGVSAPFVSGEKVVILKVEKKMDARPYRFEEVKDQLIENLAGQKSYQRFVKDLEAKTYIDIRL
jgi:peptidyl-prolyl cis-trans isomerase SurA